MKEAACVKEFGWEVVKEAIFDMTRNHTVLPCFRGEHCDFLNTQSGACTYSWPEKEKEQ